MVPRSSFESASSAAAAANTIRFSNASASTAVAVAAVLDTWRHRGVGGAFLRFMVSCLECVVGDATGEAKVAQVRTRKEVIAKSYLIPAVSPPYRVFLAWPNSMGMV